MKRLRLFDPFLLRRLVRAHERLAVALEVIAAQVSPHATPVLASHEPDEDDPELDVSYASDRDTFATEQAEAERRRRPAPARYR